MPLFTYTPLTTDDKSALSTGMHPAFLVAIEQEDTPPTWQMAQKSPVMLRWRFLVWENVQTLQAHAQPERQSMVSSMAFTPAGNFQASKAYQWTSILLGREPAKGETVDLDPLMPLPCQVMVLRTDKLGKPTEFANLNGLFPWPEGAAVRTPEFCAAMASLMAEGPAPAVRTPAPAPVAAPAQAAQSILPGTPSPSSVKW